MIKTLGLTHIALSVKDINRSSEFYQRVFGARVMYKEETFIQVQTPGSNDIIVFEKDDKDKGKTGGIKHFGFRLINEVDITNTEKIIQEAGGEIIEHGEFCPAEPYVFFHDPDGYEVELWFEKKLDGFN
ncbi:MAG TPA: VOC family protein [Ignavibacteria bacterium]